MKTGFVKSFFLSPLFFSSGVAIIFLFVFGFAFPLLFLLAKVLLVLCLATTIADGFLLYRSGLKLSAERSLPKIMGLGDDVKVKLRISYEGNIPLSARLIDELPVQLQRRDFDIRLQLDPGITKTAYELRPINKGIYHFGRLNVIIESPIHFVRRKVPIDISADVPVYPSINQMHENEILAFSRMSMQGGSKRLRRRGQSYEFEQISPFVEGDDYRNINWKASGKTRELMVNQYQDERSQNMYCIISKGRAMKMAFNNMSLLDYAINSTLAMANVALKKYDRVGLITFSDKIGTAIRAENRHGQLPKILESLYHEKERPNEPSYELLYRSIKRIVKSRSLIMLYANFESRQMMERVLPILKKINKSHLLVMVLFKDEELDARANRHSESITELYQGTLAKQHLSEKEEIAKKLQRQGIQTIVSTPDALSIDVINKYLRLKTRGMV
jgi:uncharacterized protein (DUF58 family)